MHEADRRTRTTRRSDPPGLPEDRADALRRTLRGELDLSPLARRLHSQDASPYEERPLGVARPADAGDVERIVSWAAAHRVPLIPRGGGTSLAGQCVGAGLVVDTSRHLRRVLELDAAGRRCLVQPGVVQDDLNDAAAVHGLRFAPDTSTSRQAVIGGMIGNNSGGAYSMRHGMTREHVLAVDVVLSDGSPARFAPLEEGELAARRRLDTLEGRIYREVCGVIDAHRERLLAAYPKPEITRRNTGYALDALARGRPWNPDGPPFNLAALVCGSEGTLCFVTGALLRLVPLPAHRLLVAAHFRDTEEACRATLPLLAHRPAAIELMDGHILRATRHNREQARNRFWIEGEPGAVLAVELHGDGAADLRRRADALVADLREQGLGYAFPLVAEADLPGVWALRKAGLGLLTGIPGDVKAVPGIEDAAVAPADLPAYYRGIVALTRRHGCDCACYGHAGAGLLHLRPMLDLKDPADRDRYGRILDEAADLVKRFGGSFSGEHGDGRIRAPFLRRMLSDEVYGLLVRVKDAFDPLHILNPGKVVEAPPLTDHLRAAAGSRAPEVDTVFDWSRTAGYARAAEACTGVGQCRQGSGRGTMCPSYMATNEEAYSTRGRANVLRQLLTGGGTESAWTHPDLAAVMDTCLSCKACATECPSSVDLARLKAEYLQHRMDREGVSLRSRLLGHYGFFARLARLAPDLASRSVNLPAVKRALGIAPERRVPAYARQTFAAWFRMHRERDGAGRAGDLVLFNDEFTNYTDPEVGAAAVEVLEAAGYRVVLPLGLESGRAQLSKGFLRGARRHMERAVARLAPYARRGLPIVGIEPSALLGFRDEAPDLVRPPLREAARCVAGQARLFEEFLAERAAAGALGGLRLHPLEPRAILVHGHCHQKALAGTRPTLEAVRLIPGMEVRELPSGCCGMAGSFGYEREHYALSMQVGELILFPAIRAAPGAYVCAPGTSCRRQIAEGTGRRAHHAAELLRMALE